MTLVCDGPLRELQAQLYSRCGSKDLSSGRGAATEIRNRSARDESR